MTPSPESIPAVDHYDVHLTINYSHMEIPPRCRKARLVDHQTKGVWKVPIIDPADAPVVFTIAPSFEDDVHGPRIIRQIAGKLYAPENKRVDQGPTVPGSARFPDHRSVDLYEVSDTSGEALLHEAASDVHATRLAEKVIIDGEVWALCGEPRYTVMTFGLGGNHGGTSLMLDFYDNPNIRGDSYFRADEFDEAIACAIETADNRGDSNDVQRFRNNPESYRLITVHDRAAIRLVVPLQIPHEIRDLQWDYRTARRHLERASNPHEETKTFTALCELRRRIVDAGFSPIETDVRPYEDR